MVNHKFQNAAGTNVDLKDPNVVNFVGYAYFKADGTFTMYNLDDSLKCTEIGLLLLTGKPEPL